MRTRVSPDRRGCGARHVFGALAWLLLFALAGCGKGKVDQGLESDANGYLCLGCKARFYTARNVFAGRCPQCQQPSVLMVVGQTCPADQHITIAPRGRGSGRCEKCGHATQGICIPNEEALKAWGAARKSAAEVGG
jgi:hypothetical protein